ncbi:MAG: class I SAM-dependent methyltransferase [Anaerolineae bacterium]|nr:class I SAM-dependent methyltransferase [Anaerolineae bacterium]
MITDADIQAWMGDTAERLMPCQRVLDVGARDGSSSQPYAGVGRSVIALDIEPAGLKRGIEKGHIRPGHAVVAHGRWLPFPDGIFDLVSSRWFLHEFPEQGPFLAEMRRVVRAGGWVVGVDFLATNPSVQAFLNRYIFTDEYLRQRTQVLRPWAEAGLEVKETNWRVIGLEEDAGELRELGADWSEIPGAVKAELWLRRKGNSVFLNVPVVLLVADRGEGGSCTRPGRPQGIASTSGFEYPNGKEVMGVREPENTNCKRPKVFDRRG